MSSAVPGPLQTEADAAGPTAPHPGAVVILAAGQGTRMRSQLPKVLHEFAGRSMLGHVLAATLPLRPDHVVVVVGHGRDAVAEHLAGLAPSAHAVVQNEQLGTGHAVAVALEALAELPDDATVLVMPGDAPLLTTATLRALHVHHVTHDDAVTLLSAVHDDPFGYGRVLRAVDGTVDRVVEQADATTAEQAVTECSSGVYVFTAGILRKALTDVGTDNARGEQYLPDVLPIARDHGGRVDAVLGDPAEVAGVNDRLQLAAAHRIFNDRLVTALMQAGVRIVDPATTWLDADVAVETDAVIWPGCDLHHGSRVCAGAEIGPQTSLTATQVGAGATVSRSVCINAEIGPGATVGPFAYLRPGADIGPHVKIGTFVEVKNSDVGEGSKVPHLTYVGDASIGQYTNIGAGSVFVNYDGVTKSRSVIGDHARTGADNMFVAPVHIGDGAYTAAGSVITHDVPPGALGVARARQHNVAGWTGRRRADTDAARAALAATPAPDVAASPTAAPSAVPPAKPVESPESPGQLDPTGSSTPPPPTT